MEKKIFYVACDGRQFQNESECLKHEEIVKAFSKLINFTDKDGCLFMRRFAFCHRYTSDHKEEIEEEMKARGLKKLIDSNSEIKKWVTKEENFDEASPLCKNCEFNCYNKDYGYNICQLFEKGSDTREYDQIKSATFKEELMKISSFCKEHKDCKNCPFLEKGTDRYGDRISYCDKVANIFDLHDEILEYTCYDGFDDDFDEEPICLKD